VTTREAELCGEFIERNPRLVPSLEASTVDARWFEAASNHFVPLEDRSYSRHRHAETRSGVEDRQALVDVASQNIRLVEWKLSNFRRPTVDTGSPERADHGVRGDGVGRADLSGCLTAIEIAVHPHLERRKLPAIVQLQSGTTNDVSDDLRVDAHPASDRVPRSPQPV
jgi:hypothetical protein